MTLLLLLCLALIFQASLLVSAEETSFDSNNIQLEGMFDGIDPEVLYSSIISLAKEIIFAPANLDTRDERVIRIRDLLALEDNLGLGTSSLLTATDGTSVVPEAFGANGAINIPSKTGLSSTCSNQLCDYVFYALTCKGMSVGIKKACAKYLVGAFFKCSNYPNYIYDAPSVCVADFTTVVKDLAPALFGQPQQTIAILSAYVSNVNFSSNTCERRCYQFYRQSANTFYDNCLSEVTKLNKTYPLVYGLANFYDFRNNACSNNGTGVNCYQAMVKLQSNPTPNPVNPSTYINVFNFDCTDYLGSGLSAFDKTVMKGICSKFKGQLGGCCTASAIQLVMQDQQSTTKLNIWPPCLLEYFQSTECGIELNNLCNNNSVATQTTIVGTLVMNAPSAAVLPVATVNTSVLNFMGAISGVLSGLNLGKQPFNFNKNYPFQVMITSGSISTTTGTYTFQLTMNNLNDQQAQQVASTLVSASFAAALGSVYLNSQVQVTLSTPTYSLFAANGLKYTMNDAHRFGHASMTFGVFAIVTCLTALLSFLV